MQGGLTLSLALLDFFPNSSVPFLGGFEGPTMSESHMGLGQVNQVPVLFNSSFTCMCRKEKFCTMRQVRKNHSVRCLPGRVVLPTRASLGLRTVFI